MDSIHFHNRGLFRIILEGILHLPLGQGGEGVVPLEDRILDNSITVVTKMLVAMDIRITPIRTMVEMMGIKATGIMGCQVGIMLVVTTIIMVG